MTCVNPKATGNRFLSLHAFEIYDFLHLLIRQLRQMVSVARWPSTARFCDHVSCVLCARAKEQMSRIYATRRIAGVTDNQPILDWAVPAKVRKPVRTDILPIDMEGTVPVFAKRTPLPKPARIRFVDVEIKALIYGHVARRMNWSATYRPGVVGAAHTLRMGWFFAMDAFHWKPIVTSNKWSLA